MAITHKSVTPKVATATDGGVTFSADYLMPYVRAVWTAYQSNGTTQRDIDAGAIKTTFCYGE